MDFLIEQRGQDYWASTGAEPGFFVGRAVRYQGRRGLSSAVPNAPGQEEDVYRATQFETEFGIWASVIAPTIACEGGRFTAINSYDRAAFSFGIGQFAAHVPEGDFVHLFRRLLALPEASAYFPELMLAKGRIAVRGKPPQPLEDAASTAALMAWLNPDPATIDAREVQVAARLVHWTRTSPAARKAQVAQMVDSARAHLQHAAQNLALRNVGAICCVAIVDILHQGRGGARPWAKMAAALAQPNPLEALLAIGAGAWSARIATLRAAIAHQPDLALAYWDAARGDLVVSQV